MRGEFRVDAHVHLDPIGGPHTEAPPSPTELRRYVEAEGLAALFGIYESDDRLQEFRRAVSARIFAFFWARDPERGRLPPAAEGLKLHPYLDGYELELDRVAPVLARAADHGLPILIHADDRSPELSRPSMIGSLADAYPGARFIVAHAGSYAPPADSPFPVEEDLVRELVGEAIEVSRGRDNVWLETSILASGTKAALLAGKADPDRLLLGSDYPILKESYGSIRRQEEALVALGWSEATIRRVHENARELILESSEHRSEAADTKGVTR